MSYPNQPYPPHQQQPNPSNVLSIVGIVLGCVAFLFCPPLFGIAGIICGAIAKSKGERLATAALGVSIAGLVGGMILGFVLFQGMSGI
ncbi:hypothetical protein [Streptomyces megasporus]|uniref:hypothetical protein n=1 Tax=Streptomyces megasporus TaxID=44060 RepID=UPI0004E2483A|nr:hypothetical protein [Streptomyces megasporus]